MSFKPGDRVRITNDTSYGAKRGQEFTVEEIGGGKFKYAAGEGFPGGVWLDDLELVTPSGIDAGTLRPSVDEYTDPRHESLIRQANDLQAVLRRRNEQISEQLETIRTQQNQLTEYAAQLEQCQGIRADEPTVLRALQRRIGEANAAKGFHRLHHFEDGPDDDAIRDYTTARLALITTEVAEAIEEIRAGHAVDETYYLYNDGEGEAPQIDPQGKPRKPEGVPSEIADVVIRAFDFAHEFGIDLPAMIEEKLAYNTTRPAKHGKEF